MAGGKLSARQKMINLMYLIFIAMLALNMSKEVLAAFGLMNEKLNESNVSATERNFNFMEGLAEKAGEQPEKYGPLKAKADKISAIASDYNAYLEGIKEEMKSTVSDPKDYAVMDKGDYLDNKFFNPQGVSPEGQEFLEKMKEFKAAVKEAIGDDFPEIASSVEKEFSTEPVVNRENVKVDWLDYHYKGYPLVASLTKLTQLQADIKKTESEVLSTMLAGQQTKELSFSNYQAIVVPDKTAFFSSENFKGKVVLGRFDATLKPTAVTINGKAQTTVENGQIVLDFPAGNVGEQDLKGELQFKEGDSIVKIPIESSYAVIPKPNSAVISADKMNVVYRGVKNPMTISIPGVPNVTANAPGLSSAGGAGKYIMDVTTLKSRTVKINVSGKLPGGTGVSDSKTFRVKDIPRPVGTVRGEDGTIKMQRNSLQVSTIGAILPDFDFDIKLNVAGFSFKVPGQPTIKVNGSRLNSQAKGALRKAKRGSTIQVFDINAQLATNKSYRVKKVSPIIIELTN